MRVTGFTVSRINRVLTRFKANKEGAKPQRTDYPLLLGIIAGRVTVRVTGLPVSLI